MRIYNNGFYKIPKFSIFMLIISSLYIIAGIIFISFPEIMFSDIAGNMKPGYVLILTVMLISLIMLLFRIIQLIISRNSDNKNFNSEVNLKYVDIEPSKINFNFNYPQYNFICKYDEIENMEIILYTGLYNNGCYTVSKIKLNFTLSNGKIYSLLNVLNLGACNMNLFYSLIDAGKKMQKFSYIFEGAGIDEITKEKLELYKNRGLKLFLSNDEKNVFIVLSVLFFVIGIVIIFVLFWCGFMGDIIKNDFSLLIIPIIMFLFSFIADICIFVDWVHKKKYNIQ